MPPLVIMAFFWQLITHSSLQNVFANAPLHLGKFDEEFV